MLNAIVGVIGILDPDLGLKLVELRGVGFIVLGLAFAYWASRKSSGDSGTKVPPNLIAGISSALVIIGIILITFDVAIWLSEKGAWTLFKLSGWSATVYNLVGLSLTVWPLAFGVIALAFVTGFFVNLNYISIHRYYRDRLMETFMPDIDKALDNVTGPALGSDSAFFHELSNPEAPHCPYHIVNTNVVLVDSKERTRRGRGGDSFILSPSYCGSNATGWRPTNKFMDGKMTLATAMAISGAAANPNTGVGGTGITRNRLLSFLMAFLNLRLGYWVPHPTKLKESRIRPNHFLPGLYEVVKAGYHEDRWFLQISDGGHFENLGLYELVRRRCRVIVVCDGGADADYSFSDLQVTLRYILADFGAHITFDADNRPEKLIPKIDVGYPKGVMLAEQGHIVGEITYAKDEKGAESAKGTLIFLKTTLVSGLSLGTLGYAGANRDFPDQKTLDQFFDEEQFEAYRELGYTIAKEMINDIRTNNEYDDKAGLREFIPKIQ